MHVLRKYGFAIAVLLLCAAMGLYLYLSSSKGSSVNLDQNLKAPNFALTDLDNNKVTLDETNGKVRVVYFFYANCPDVCPPTTYLMTQVQNKLKEKGSFGKDVEFMWVTFDPKRDTTEALKEYSSKFDIDTSGWKFLREDNAEATEKLMKDFGLGLLKDEKTNTFTHTDTIAFVDRKGVVRKYLTGSIDETQSADKIVDVINALVKD
ncbi:SCO family protein [Paenibacillus sacheonensis]|uniref:Redoxin family protein n=1 Tax=Paenibacillus sacheonensis TaxID=742054 RepID=A0A7X4YNU8_9BACL|nr:SCO family protein [Paenibacillus sacheonensis]MBM7567416.1 protein SCO1/2 [Paenibacillus sacheonensis]NBC69802.1 redoxin family protein [Paenibacillus sacheonensis]